MAIAKIKRQEGKAFIPFEITLSIEDLEEARLLFHVFNHSNIKETMIKNGYSFSMYDKDISDNFLHCAVEPNEVYRTISNEIRDQGFKL